MKPRIDRAKIKRVYSGKPGCACGCLGNYSESKGSITKVLKKFDEAFAVNEMTGLDGETIIYWDSPDRSRTYTIYLQNDSEQK